MAGSDVTQANVIDQHEQGHRRHGGGVADMTNWTNGHNEPMTIYPLCSAFVQVKGNTFVPALNRRPGVFDCFGPGKPVNAGVPSHRWTEVVLRATSHPASI